MSVEITAEMISEDSGVPVKDITIGPCCNYNELKRKIDDYLFCLYSGIPSASTKVELWSTGVEEDYSETWYAYATTGSIDMKILKKGETEYLIAAIGQERSIYPVWLDA